MLYALTAIGFFELIIGIYGILSWKKPQRGILGFIFALNYMELSIITCRIGDGFFIWMFALSIFYLISANKLRKSHLPHPRVLRERSVFLNVVGILLIIFSSPNLLMTFFFLVPPMSSEFPFSTAINIYAISAMNSLIMGLLGLNATKTQVKCGFLLGSILLFAWISYFIDALPTIYGFGVLLVMPLIILYILYIIAAYRYLKK